MSKSKFDIPENLTDLDIDALNAAIGEAQSEADSFESDDLSDEDLERLEALAGFVNAARAEKGTREAAAAERAQRAEAARAALVEPEEPEEPEAPEAPEEPVAEAPAEQAASAETEPAKGEPVVASAAPAKRPSASAAAKRQAAPPVVKRAGFSLIAQTDVPDFAAGHKFSGLAEMGQAVKARMEGMPTQFIEGFQQKYPTAKIVRPEGDGVFDQNDFRTDDEMLLAASQESRLKGGSLVAAGGWDAPSETLYDLCPGEETTEGIINLPEVTIRRGGVSYTKGISFGDIMAGTGYFDLTEAQVEAGTPEKTPMTPPDVTFVEQRLSAVGVYIQAGILTRLGYPEVIQRFIAGALVAHQHKVAQKVISQIQTLAGAAINVPNGFGNALDVLHVVEVVIQGERERLKMSQNATMEVVLPSWVKGVIRADLAQRNGVEAWNVTDAQINSYFTNRKARVQWIYNYQELDVSGGVATTYPDTVEMLVYPAGTYVKGTSPVIRLDTVYDSVLLPKNKYIALFLEEGVVVTNPCNDGHRITLPLLANGRTGAASDANDSLFNTPVA